MDNGNTIKNYTAEDIRNYHQGLMTPAERHAIEKAALDDPFLADALEGYAYSTTPASDLDELKQRLDKKLESAKVIPLQPVSTRRNYNWMKVAAMLVLFAGASYFVYEFAFKNKDGDIAMNESKKVAETTAQDSSVYQSPLKDSVQITTPQISNGLAKTETKMGSATSTLNADVINTEISKADTGFANDEKDIGKAKLNEIKESPSAAYEMKKEPAIETARAAQRNDISYNQGLKAKTFRQSEQQRENYFRGRVVDLNNKPVPFANIINTRDNAGTYTDARGYFNLISPDSILEVQVSSVGYEINNAQIRNNISNNQLVMRNDSKGLDEVVVSKKYLNSAERSKDISRKLEEPEPADGWENYDTYLVNNLIIPEDLRTKETAGEVQLSFEVDKNGVPVNIRVEKSLCGSCDQEAIRLLKEGPKWKRKNKRSRTTLRVPF
jgi:hypothetical protein